MSSKDLYSLGDFISDKSRIITNDEKEKIEAARTTIIYFSDFCLFYYNLEKNTDSLIDFLDKLDKTNTLTEYNNRMLFADVNRITANFLSSFYSLIEFLERKISSFPTIKKIIYDNHFEYRLFYELRKYMTHQGFAITKIKTFLGKETINVKAIFDSNKLIESKECNAKFRKELQAIENKDFILLKHAIEFKKTIKSLLQEIINHEGLAIKNAHSILSTERNKTSRDKGDCYLIKNEKPIWSLIRTLNTSLERCYIGLLAGENINLLQKNLSDEYVFFRHLCSIYYGNDNSVPTFVDIS